VLVIAATTAVALGEGIGNQSIRYPATRGTYIGVRATSVGLPQVGLSGTVGASDLPNALRKYHDSGDYDLDLKTMGDRAKAYLQQRLAERAHPPQSCATRYRRKRVRNVHKALYVKVRKCKPAPQPAGKPAIVLDIDETSLSNYKGIVASNFSQAGTVPDAVAGTGTVIQPTLDLFDYAKANGVAVFFITGRPSVIQSITETNLKAAGYDGWTGLQFKPGDMTTLQYKSGARAAIEKQGYYIYESVGDQESDLDGGHAEQGFKYPNPFYFIADQ
jgi:predicted secreted acid phosphatase